MRKLATKRKIKQLLDIKGKDRIVLAIIDGWSVIVKKDEFNVGDECIFFEIDSFLPAVDPFTFLGTPTTYEGKQGYRLRTMRMASCLSQGLALPLTHFILDYDRELDEQLGVVKYDVAEVCNQANGVGLLAGNAGDKFPSFIPKTDEERIQNLTKYYEQYKTEKFYVAEKLDGSSATFYLKDGLFGVCSRNMDLLETEGNSCPYLGLDFKCSIYEDRPEVCRLYGNEQDINLTCQYQDKNGRMRSRQEKRIIESKIKKFMDSWIKKHKHDQR
jgi:RNA ligase (TIGR02306 family)